MIIDVQSYRMYTIRMRVKMPTIFLHVLFSFLHIGNEEGAWVFDDA